MPIPPSLSHPHTRWQLEFSPRLGGTAHSCPRCGTWDRSSSIHALLHPMEDFRRELTVSVTKFVGCPARKRLSKTSCEPNGSAESGRRKTRSHHVLPMEGVLPTSTQFNDWAHFVDCA